MQVTKNKVLAIIRDISIAGKSGQDVVRDGNP